MISPKHSPELDGTSSDESDDWADDIVLVDSMPISYIVSTAPPHPEDGSDDEDDSIGASLFRTRTVAPPTIIAEDFGPPYAPSYFPAHISHHGLSRSALQHHKWLWGARYDEWMQWQADVEEAAAAHGAYGGILDVSALEPPPGLRSRSPSPLPPVPTPSPAPVAKADVVNPRIFPRTGDLAALHDPHSAHVDRVFSNYPLCTLQKALFALSMRGGGAEHDGAFVSSAAPAQAQDRDDCGSSGHDDDSTSSAESVRKEQPAWERVWDPRWEVLQELVNLSEGAMPDVPRALVTTSFGLPVVLRTLDSEDDDEAGAEHEHDADEDEDEFEFEFDGRARSRFFIAEDEDVDGARVYGDEDEYDEEDEDDYGEILLNPRFRGPFAVERDAAPSFCDSDRHGHGLHIDSIEPSTRRARLSF
jgi:hypothetical protein